MSDTAEDLEIDRLVQERTGQSHRVYRIDDPAAFWSSLTPAQALALLKAAPKVAGARHGTVGCTWRDDLVANINVGFVFFSASENQQAIEAEEDQRMRANGWVLFDGE